MYTRQLITGLSPCTELRLRARLSDQRRHTGRGQLLDGAEEEHRTVPLCARRTCRQVHDVSAGVHAHGARAHMGVCVCSWTTIKCRWRIWTVCTSSSCVTTLCCC